MTLNLTQKAEFRLRAFVLGSAPSENQNTEQFRKATNPERGKRIL